MIIEERLYQVEAISAGISFLKSKEKKNGLIVVPTAGGKSIIIAKTITGLEGNVAVFQPNIEILKQNYEKYIGHASEIKNYKRAGIYSASAGQKHMEAVTFLTIGSITKKLHLLREFKYILIDECHLVNPEEGMYKSMFDYLKGSKVVGYTATPYRLSSSQFSGSELRFLTRQTPRVFNKLLYCIQNHILFDAGYLAPLKYFKQTFIDRRLLEVNKKGSDFTDLSLKRLQRSIDLPGKTIELANRLLVKRKSLLIFCSLIEEAERVSRSVPGSQVLTGETDDRVRDRMLKQFKRGDIPCIVNVSVLTAGFDFPGLECVLIARPTMSLALYYQMIGRSMRKFVYPDGTLKEGWVVDIGGNIDMFGKVETMMIEYDRKGLPMVTNLVDGVRKQLTNVPFKRAITD